MLKLLKIAVVLSICISTHAFSSIKNSSKNQDVVEKQSISELDLHTYSSHLEQKHIFYIQSGLHGNEKGAVAFTKWMMGRIKNNRGPWRSFRNDSTIEVVPVANPNGYASNSRYNTVGVNLNRNFNVLHGLTKENPGVKAFSEIETKKIRNLFHARQYTGAIDIHGYINWIIGPSNPYILGTFDEKSPEKIRAYKKLMNILSHQTASLDSYELKTAGGLGDGGSFEDWAFWSEGVPALCLEVSKVQSKTNFLKYEQFIIQTFNQIKTINSKVLNKVAVN